MDGASEDEIAAMGEFGVMLFRDKLLQALSQIAEVMIMTEVKTGFINSSFGSLVEYKVHQQLSHLLKRIINNKSKKNSVLPIEDIGDLRSCNDSISNDYTHCA